MWLWCFGVPCVSTALSKNVSGQDQWDWARMSNRKRGFHLNWLTKNSTKHTDKLDISYVEWAKEESYLNSW